VKLTDMIQETLIFADLEAPRKEEALRTMADRVALTVPEVGGADLFKVIMDRERLCSTGIGSGIAIPHAKFPDLKSHLVAVGRSRAGIDYEAIDGKPVHLVFMIVGPLGSNETHLKTLARISKFLHDTNFRDNLLTAATAKDIYNVIAEKDSQY
jgi:mannitol/fructose-specific phosphotransferase system IIA component (Ntr-type)